MCGEYIDGSATCIGLGDDGAVDIGGDGQVDFMEYGVDVHCYFGRGMAPPLDEVVGAHGVALQVVDFRLW